MVVRCPRRIRLLFQELQRGFESVAGLPSPHIAGDKCIDGEQQGDIVAVIVEGEDHMSLD